MQLQQNKVNKKKQTTNSDGHKDALVIRSLEGLVKTINQAVEEKIGSPTSEVSPGEYSLMEGAFTLQVDYCRDYILYYHQPIPKTKTRLQLQVIKTVQGLMDEVSISHIELCFRNIMFNPLGMEWLHLLLDCDEIVFVSHYPRLEN